MVDALLSTWKYYFIALGVSRGGLDTHYGSKSDVAHARYLFLGSTAADYFLPHRQLRL